MSKKSNKKKNMILNILIAICCVVFLYSGYQLLNYYREYKKIDNTNANINKLVLEENDLTIDDHGKLLRAPKIDMQELKKINSDVCGYILIPNTKISFPLLYNKDMNKYLRHDIYLNYSNGGCIFLDASNQPDLNDDNTIIYGHHMYNGTMFTDLDLYFKEETFLQEHPYIYIYTEDEIRLYKIFAGHITEATSDVYTTYFHDENEKANYIHQQIANSAFETGEIPSSKDNIITLSTCTSVTRDGRYVLFANLITSKKLS